MAEKAIRTMVSLFMNKSIDHCYSIADLRLAAKRKLPRAVFDYIDGGAEDEVTLDNNRNAFDRYQLNARALVDVSNVDLSTTVLGEKTNLPIILSPTAMTKLFHHEGETAVALAAKKSGTIYSLSSMSTTSIEDVAKVSDAAKWFQLYVWRDRALLKEFIQRAKDSGYKALCLTVDLPVHGNREKDQRNGLAIPPKPTPKVLIDTLRHPIWLYHYLRSDAMKLANINDNIKGDHANFVLQDYINSQFDPSLSWDDTQWMIEQWDGPFIIKGIMNIEDAKRAAAIGANAIVVSNHGGRQLDHAPGTLDLLPEIVDAVGDKLDVLIDGGIRRGTDILKALALGAKACMIGRSYLYGLGAGGTEGVSRAIELLGEELERNMKLTGCRSIDEITSELIREKR